MDILGFGVQVMLIGLVVVFVGLILLIICVKIMDKLVNKSEAGKPAAPAPAPVAPAPVSAPQVEAGISPEVLAAITAAICAYAPAGKSLVVRSVRRKDVYKRQLHCFENSLDISPGLFHKSA